MRSLVYCAKKLFVQKKISGATRQRKPGLDSDRDVGVRCERHVSHDERRVSDAAARIVSHLGMPHT